MEEFGLVCVYLLSQYFAHHEATERYGRRQVLALRNDPIASFPWFQHLRYFDSTDQGTIVPFSNESTSRNQ